MNSHHLVHRSRAGQVLLPVLGFLFLTLGMVLSIVAVSSNHRKIVTKQVSLDQAMYVAEAGLERGCRYIDTNVAVLVASLTTSASTNINGSFKGGTYSYCIKRLDSTTFSIVSTGTYDSISRQVSMLRIYQPTYAEFALWSHQNGAIYLKDGEVFNGHVHADDSLYFSTIGGGPVFHAECSSAASTWYTDGATLNGNISVIEFDKGFDLSSYQGQMADVDFNSAASSSLKSIANSVGLVLSGSSTITFNGGTFTISNTAKGWANHSYSPNTTNGIIYVANNGTTAGANAGIIYLAGGNISGRITIVAENDIFVRGNITYTTDPRVNSSSTCALGLITQDDIRVDTTAPNNLEIDAAMMATGTSSDGSPGSFGVDSYNSGSARGTLTLYGGIVQDIRGAVGTFNSSGVTTTGYSKNYSYDPRFISNPPPYYPAVSGQIRFSNWTEGPKQ